MTDERDLFGNEISVERIYDIGGGKTIGRNSLHEADRETQVAAMKNWFYANYENPAENTPYIGSEGGYQFIHGGPFDAREELENEFSGIIPDDVVNEVVEAIEDHGTEWAPVRDFEYDDYLFDSIVAFTEHYAGFDESISNTRYLAQVEVPSPQDQHFYRILHVSVINALEAYLSDNFISTVCGNKARVQTFVETDRYFSKGEVPIKDIFKRMETIEDEVKVYLLKLTWHRIADVRRMFHDTLHVLFPDNLDEIQAAIRVRHDIVHRGGKKKDGSYHQITKNDIDRTARAAEELVSFIERQMNPEPVKPPEGSDEHSDF